MGDTERRQAERRPEISQISMVVAGSQELEAKTVNLSATGVLLQAKGSIRVVLNIRGQRYSGRLVRGFPVEPGTTAWAIELDPRTEES